ncbi:hypothetical protein BGZ49_000445 [Haplosporangium sp. Z 27]|nr:hypothetical protein BGZ49_000445 [Haplosporangium sp. Z 27]
MFGDDDDDLELSFKKRYKGTQASSQGSFGWSGLLESVASGAEHDIPRASTLSEQSHFEQIISPQYDPSTPPLETGPFQANASHFNFQPTDGSMLRNVIESRELNLDIGLEHSHEGISIRPLSPAPSSPSESIEDIERSDTSLRQNLNNTVIDKRVSVGRSSFTMGYKPGCERCLRREKGHFAHFG